jgi:hypothetical protein
MMKLIDIFLLRNYGLYFLKVRNPSKRRAQAPNEVAPEEVGSFSR